MAASMMTAKNVGGVDPSRQQQQDEALDAPLIALTQMCGGDLGRLLTAFFSFLHRRTDFYMVLPVAETSSSSSSSAAAAAAAGAAGRSSVGFREGDAEKLLVAAFRQFPLRRVPTSSAAGKVAAGAAASAASASSGGKKKPSSNSSSSSGSGHQTKQEEGSTTSGGDSPDGAAAAAAAAASKTSASASGASKKKEDSGKGGTNDETVEAGGGEGKKDGSKGGGGGTGGTGASIRHTEEGLQVPVGNGGSAEKYTWTQTIDECSVVMGGLPEGCRGRDLDVSIKPTTLSVKLKKGKKPDVLLEGTLTERVVPDESTWTLEGGALVVTLYKRAKTFWKSVLVGDPEIDTTLVDSRRHVGDYDEATQAQIRKIIYEQSLQRKQEEQHQQQSASHGGGSGDSNIGRGVPRIPPSAEIVEIKHGETPKNLPPGVEYIDNKTLEGAARKGDGGGDGVSKGE